MASKPLFSRLQKYENFSIRKEFNNYMKKIVLLLMIITIVSKILGLGREIALSYYYGASNIADAYLISLTIPMSILSFIGAGIATGFIPLYTKIEKEIGVERANLFTNNLLNILFVFCTIVIVLGLVFTPSIVKIFASGFDKDTLELSVYFTRITLFGIYLSMATYIFTGFLHINDNYHIPALIGLPFSLFTILSILISSKGNTVVLSIGSLIAIASQLLLLIPFVIKKGYKYNFIIVLKDKYIREMMYLSIPVVIGVSVNQINTLVDRTIASSIVVGGISALNYANRLNLFIQGLFVVSIINVMYPKITKMLLQGDIDNFRKIISKAINSINLLVIPTTLGAMLFAKPIVNMLFGRGAFDTQALIMTTNALFYYSIGMLGFGLRDILTRVFYSMQDTKTPMINAIIGMFLNLILNIILSRYLGLGGLALATSISAIFTTVILFISLHKKMGPIGIRKMSISFIKILGASLIMCGIAKLSFNYLTTDIFPQNLSLIISIGIGALTYFAIIYFMKIEDVDVIVKSQLSQIRNRFKIGIG